MTLSSTTQPDRQALIALGSLAAEGDSVAQERLYRVLYPAIHKHLGFLLGFDAIVEDAVQETMMAIHRGLPRFRGDASPVTWGLAIATRTGRRYMRRERRSRGEELSPKLEALEISGDQGEAAELAFLSKALVKLAPKKREAFALMGLWQMSASEAAIIAKTSANTLASRYRHAKSELQAIYKQEDNEQEEKL